MMVGRVVLASKAPAASWILKYRLRKQRDNALLIKREENFFTGLFVQLPLNAHFR